MEAPITHVHLERVADDELLVSWRGATDVAVFVSGSADDAGTDIIEPAGPRVARVTGVPRDERVYVHLLAPGGPFVVAAERLVPLEGTRNFRDIGGYPVAGGGHVRWGRVFRSDHLSELSADDLTTLRVLDVRTVIDLRGPHELVAQPSAVPADGPISMVHLPVGDGSVDGVPLRELVEKGHLEHFSVDDMALLYEVMLEEHADVFATIVMAVADRHDALGGALVYHCTAGKDRTGLATALLLLALGVDEALVLDDYELTNRYRSDRRVEELRPVLAAQGLDIDRFLPLFTASRSVMHLALDGLRRRHGSAARYLVEAGGIDGDVLRALRDKLVVDGPS